MAKTQHEEIMFKLGSIENHLKTLNGTVKKNIDDIDTLQKNQNKFLGATAVISSIFLFVGGVLAKIFIK